MGKHNLKNDLKDKYGLTGMEVDDILRYMRKLCDEFERLAKKYKSEYLIELQTHQEKAKKNKAEQNVFLKFGKSALNSLSSSAKELRQQFQKTGQARKLVLTSIMAHKLRGDEKEIITDILSLMAEHNEFRNNERVITGRRAYESLLDAGIEV